MHLLFNFFNFMLTLCICQVLILKTCRMYNMFGSGASHAIYAQFMAQLTLTNRGRKVRLIRGAGTRMALWFYAMICLICLQQPLKATIHQQNFLDLALTNSTRGQFTISRTTTFGSACTSYFVLCFLYSELFGTAIQTRLAWTNCTTYLTGPQ
jgi:hypothetical protein